MRLPVNHALPLMALILLGAGGAIAKDRPAGPDPAGRTGPAADYPVVVGDPFTIGETIWTPTDQLNYDAVGQASTGDGAGITAAHKTLPLPCYVEVTSLDTGRTILVRVERRGPMVNNVLIELSPAASVQLGIAPGASSPVRVRRVVPPEPERAALRTGEEAPLRIATPEGLLKVLRRKLAEQSPLAPPPSIPPRPPEVAPEMLADMEREGSASAVPGNAAPLPAPTAPAQVAAPAPGPAPAPKPAAGSAPAPAAAKGSIVVQVAAFSSKASADKVSASLGGFVTRPGKYWLVRLGPFGNGAQAGPALEKARSAGYRDARIQKAD